MRKSVIIDLGTELEQMYLEADTLRGKIQAALDTRNRLAVDLLVEQETQLFDKIEVVEKMYVHKPPIEMSN